MNNFSEHVESKLEPIDKFSKKKPIKLFKKFVKVEVNFQKMTGKREEAALITNKPLLERKIKISMKLKSSLERKFPLR